VLTDAELEAVFAATHIPGGRPGSTSGALGDRDLQELLRSLGDTSPAAPAPAPYPAKWAGAPRTGTWDYDDVYGDDPADADADADADTPATETEKSLRELENSVATVDDRTVAIRDSLGGVAEDVRTLQDQVDGVVGDLDTVKAQNVALGEEVRDLRTAVDALRVHVATLVELLTSRTRAVAAVAAAAPAATPAPAPATPAPTTPAAAVTASAPDA
jgi:hypothetical protein